MTCPKINPRYPDTSSRVERPFGVMVRQADRDFDKCRRFDRAYEFEPHIFKEDALVHGAYIPLVYDFNEDFNDDFLTANVALRQQNGFCRGS